MPSHLIYCWDYHGDSRLANLAIGRLHGLHHSESRYRPDNPQLTTVRTQAEDSGRGRPDGLAQHTSKEW